MANPQTKLTVSLASAQPTVIYCILCNFDVTNIEFANFGLSGSFE